VLQACAAVAIALGAAAHVIGERQHKQAIPSSTVSRVGDITAAAAAAQADVSDFDDSARPVTAAEQAPSGGDSCSKHDANMHGSCRHRQQHQNQSSCDTADSKDTSAMTLHIEIGSNSSPSCTMQEQQQQEEPLAKLQRQRSIQLGSNSRFLGLAMALVGKPAARACPGAVRLLCAMAKQIVACRLGVCTDTGHGWGAICRCNSCRHYASLQDQEDADSCMPPAATARCNVGREARSHCELLPKLWLYP
jgi:hypothetical protein